MSSNPPIQSIQSIQSGAVSQSPHDTSNPRISHGSRMPPFSQTPPASANSIPMYLQNMNASSAPAGSLGVSNTVNSSCQTNTAADMRRKADKQPWRYRGYPAFCTWMASDEELFIVRRFGNLAARVALFMQDHIVELEENLQKEDQLCREAEDQFADSGTFRQDPRLQRQKIMIELTHELARYQSFLLDHSSLKARPEATESQIRNIRRWLRDSNGAIADKEIAYIQQTGDLIPIVPKSKTPMRRFFDRFDCVKKLGLFRNQKLNNQLYDPLKDFESETTIYNNESRIDKFATCVTLVVGVSMLVGPLWLLQWISARGQNVRLSVISAFLIGFTLLLSMVTVAKPFEVLAASAAYAAVLMVFMQLGSPLGS